MSLSRQRLKVKLQPDIDMGLAWGLGFRHWYSKYTIRSYLPRHRVAQDFPSLKLVMYKIGQPPYEL